MLWPRRSGQCLGATVTVELELQVDQVLASDVLIASSWIWSRMPMNVVSIVTWRRRLCDKPFATYNLNYIQYVLASGDFGCHITDPLANT